MYGLKVLPEWAHLCRHTLPLSHLPLKASPLPASVVWGQARPACNLLYQDSCESTWCPPSGGTLVTQYDGLGLAKPRPAVQEGTSYREADPSDQGFLPWGSSHMRMIPASRALSPLPFRLAHRESVSSPHKPFPPCRLRWCPASSSCHS